MIRSARRRLRRSHGVISIGLVAVSIPCALVWGTPPETRDEFYSNQVRPILERHCFACHSHATGKARGGVMLDSVESMWAGGDSGPVLDREQREQSLLLAVLRRDADDLRMPPEGKLEDEELAVIETWLREHLATPAEVPTRTAKPDPLTALREQGSRHWAFRTLPVREILRRHAVESESVAGIDARPTLSRAIDRSLEHARQALTLTAAPRADARTLVRRLYFDLWGLPPTPLQVESFVSDTRSDAWTRLVDQLLAAPEFAERWARHWLDVARYADSNGCSIESNNTFDDAWRYRDYVIESIYRDKRYDQFVREQVAGDLLEALSDQQRAEQLIATGFLLLGPKAFGTSEYEVFRLDALDEQIDTIGKAFLGLSWGCARCHDHKVDPMSTREYYALAGMFSSSACVREEKGWRQGRTWNRVALPVLEPAVAAQLTHLHRARLEAAAKGTLKEEADAAEKTARDQLTQLEKEAAPAERIQDARLAVERAAREARNAGRLAKVLPIVSPVPAAMAVVDATALRDESVRQRGVADARGEVVPRAVPDLFGIDSRFAVPQSQSGRKQLADWIVDVDHGAGGLAARVCVNRVWGRLLGRPLVGSVDNFGLSAAAPEHPELLELLAASFVRDAWSMRSLLRGILLSDTYQQSSRSDPENLAKDPANVYQSRHMPRRLDAEAFRDGLLLLSQQLDRTRGGKTLQYQGLLTIDSDRIELDTPDPYRRRSIYVPILRDALDIDAGSRETLDVLNTFDFADPNLPRGDRQATAAPAQPLLILNSDFVYRQAKALAEDLLAKGDSSSDAHRYQELAARLYCRPAGDDECARALEYLRTFQPESAEDRATHQLDPRLAAWTSLCQVAIGSAEFLFVR